MLVLVDDEVLDDLDSEWADAIEETDTLASHEQTIASGDSKK